MKPKMEALPRFKFSEFKDFNICEACLFEFSVINSGSEINRLVMIISLFICLSSVLHTNYLDVLLRINYWLLS